MRRRKALLEEQAHRIALIAEARLDADEDIPEALAEHEDRGAVALLAAGRGTPLRLDLGEPALAPDMVAGADPDMDIRHRAIARGIALDDRLAQPIDAVGNRDAVALGPHRQQRPVQRFEHREIGRRAGVAGIGREVEQHDADLAFGPGRAPQRHQLLGPCRQHLGALGADMHVALAFAGRELAGAAAAGAVPGLFRAPAEDDRAGRAVELGNRDHDGRFDRQQAAIRRAPLVECLELGRMRREVGHVEPRQDLLRRPGIVVGGATDQ